MPIAPARPDAATCHLMSVATWALGAVAGDPSLYVGCGLCRSVAGAVGLGVVSVVAGVVCMWWRGGSGAMNRAGCRGRHRYAPGLYWQL